MTETEIADTLAHQVRQAQAGDRIALEDVVLAIQPDVRKLALRFLCCPHDAEDASQEILIRVLTGLSTFRGESNFRTWVYRVASNTLLNLRRQHLEQQNLSFTSFAADLQVGLSDMDNSHGDPQSEYLLLEEVKVGCTLALLQCLGRDQRMAYILGEIMEFEHIQAAAIMDITQAAFRKRLSRARASINDFMLTYCGLVNQDAACRCHRRVGRAIAIERVDAAKLHYATSLQQAKRFPMVLAHIRQLEDIRRAVALYQSHPETKHSDTFINDLRKLLDNRHGTD